MVKTISIGKVKEIYDKVNSKFTVVNMGTYIVINELERNEATSYTYDTNYVYLHYCQMIRVEYILAINETMQYFNWRLVGFDVVSEREKYLTKIIDKVIEYGCGFKRKN
jgi:hypothetical protein